MMFSFRGMIYRARLIAVFAILAPHDFGVTQFFLLKINFEKMRETY